MSKRLATSLALLFSLNHTIQAVAHRENINSMVHMRFREVKLPAQRKIRKWLTQQLYTDLTEQRFMIFSQSHSAF